jgi:hypothetical protein
VNLEELKALCEDATPGPWTAMDYDHSPGDQGVPIIGGGLAGSMEGHLTAYTMTLNNVSQSELDAQFIVAARTALPKLIAAVEAVLAIEDPVLGDRVAENLVKQGKYSMLIKVHTIINNILEES